MAGSVRKTLVVPVATGVRLGVDTECLLWAQALGTPTWFKQVGKAKSPGTGWFKPGTRALLVGSAAPPGAALTRVSGEGRGHVAAREERVASSQPPEDRTAAGLQGNSSRAGQADGDGSSDGRANDLPRDWMTRL